MPSPRRAPADTDDRLSFSAGPALALAGIGVPLALAGFAAVGAPLAVPGTGLVVLGALTLLITSLVARGVHVQGRAVNATVTEGEVVHLELTVSGHRLLGLVGATVEHPLLAEPFPLLHGPGGRGGGLTQFSGLFSRRPRRLPLTGRARRRGRMQIPAPSVRFSDALGLTEARRQGNGDMGELLVLPRIEPVHFLETDLSGAVAHARTMVASTEATDLAGLRDYQIGTPATRIYWPALARGGTLLERYFEGEIEIAPLVAVDPRGAGSPEDTARLDTVIRAAASLTRQLARSGPVDLLVPGAVTPLRITPTLGSWAEAHRALALVDEQPATAAPPRLPGDRAGVLFYACAYPSLALVAERRWAGRLLMLAPRAAAGGGLPVLEVAGCIATAVTA